MGVWEWVGEPLGEEDPGPGACARTHTRVRLRKKPKLGSGNYRTPGPSRRLLGRGVMNGDQRLRETFRVAGAPTQALALE